MSENDNQVAVRTETKPEVMAQVPVNLPAGLPSKEEIEAISWMAGEAWESKFYVALGGKPGIVAYMLYARELGMPYMLALNKGLHNVQGRMEMSSLAMNMRIRERGHRLVIKETTAERCTLWGKRADTGEEYEVTHTIEHAKRRLGGTIKTDSVWAKDPESMNFSGAMRWLTRRLFPEVLGGCFAEGEVSEIFGETIDVTPQKQTRTRKIKTQSLLPNSSAEQAPVEVETVAGETTEEPTGAPEDATGESNELDTETESIMDPAPETLEMLATIEPWITKKLSLDEGGLATARQVIANQFGVDDPRMIPGDKIADLKAFARTQLVQALTDLGFGAQE